MSYTCCLVDPVTHKTLHIDEPHFMRGSTYCIGGSTRLSLDITYNYYNQYKKVFGDNGIRSLNGMSGVDSIPIIQKAISLLNNDISDDYWESTEGNAKKALFQLEALAKMRPDGIWDID